MSDGNFLYLQHQARHIITDEVSQVVYKININTFAQEYFFELPDAYSSAYLSEAKVSNGDFYCMIQISSGSGSPHHNLPVLGGGQSHVPSGDDIYIFKVNSSGNQTVGTYIGNSGNDYWYNFDVFNGYIFTVFVNYNPNYITTDGTSNSIGSVVTKVLTPDGSTLHLGYAGRHYMTSNYYRPKINANNGCFLVSWVAKYYNYFEYVYLNNPVTVGPNPPPLEDEYSTVYLKKYGFNASGIPTNNEITPLSQQPCYGGYVAQLDGNKLASPYGFTAFYQWQVSTVSETGPWTDIPYANAEDYQPNASAITKYYRRLALPSPFCNPNPTDTLSFSNVSTVLLSIHTAPTVDAGGVKVSCPGLSVNLGGSPTAQGGTPNYTYDWDYGLLLSDSTIANPIATTNESAIFTLKVTDDAGCIKYDQATVKMLKVDAGSDASICPGQSSVNIGDSAPFPASTGVTYSWSPTTGLACATCAQTIANPSVTTEYELTATLSGGVCVVKDTVVVHVVSPPASNFAGTDKYLCIGESTTLGLTAESGFSYSWMPSKYLSSYNIAQPETEFDNGYPLPNPYSYIVTATKEGCTFTDEVKVYIQHSGLMAGADNYCGPRTVGLSDQTSNINETFTWTKISGDGSILGPTNTSTTIVSATTSGNTVYELTSTFMGHTCTDTVIVPDSCGTNSSSCSLSLFPSTCVQQNDIVTATELNNRAGTITWSPCTGLSTCTGASVTITDNIPRVLTATFTSSLDPSFTCTQSIYVNYPYPDKIAKDTILCPPQTACLGSSPISGLTYQWYDPNNDLTCDDCSNPCTGAGGSYFVTITNTTSQCHIVDTADVVIRTPQANAGPDLQVCSNAIVTIGDNDIVQGYQYLWSPSNAPWRNSTNQYTPNPDVFVASELEFIVTVTDLVTGCFDKDTMNTYITSGPPITAVAGPDTAVCKGSGVQLGITPNPSLIYSWSPSTGLSCTDCANPIASPTVNTTYSCSYTYAGDCAISYSDDVNVTVNELVIDLGLDVNYCEGEDEVELGSSLPLGMTSYSWSPATGLSDIDTRITFAYPTANTTYTVTVVDLNGCSDTDEVTVNVSKRPFAGTNINKCFDGLPIELGSSSNPATVTWSPTDNLSCTTCSQTTFTPTAFGTYTIIATITGAPGCIEPQANVVTINLMETPSVELGTPITYCPTGGPVNIGNNAPSGMDAYTWSPSNYLSSTTAQNPTSTSPVSTVYELKVQLGLCYDIDSIEVNPAIAPIAGPNRTACKGDAVLLGSASNPAGTTWTPISGLSCTTCAQPTFTANTAGSHTFTASYDDNGCIQTKNVTINVVQEPTPPFGNPSSICQNACVQIGGTAQSGKSYLWSPTTGLNDPTISNPTACLGTTNEVYTVVVTDLSTNCTATKTVVASVYNVSAPSINVPQVEVCLGENGQFNPSVTGGSGNYSYFWTPSSGISNNAISDPIVYGAPTGERYYSLNVFDINTGCSTFESDILVTVNNCLTLSGVVWNDINGNININGSELVTNLSNQLYVYLVNEAGIIIDKMPVNNDGSYLFQIEENSKYDVVLSNVGTFNIGDSSPTPSLPTGWLNTGENKNGTTEITTLGLITVNSYTSNIINQDFGIEQPPTTVDQTYVISQPAENSSSTLTPTSGMNLLNGFDPEDGAKTTGNSFAITDLSGMNGNTLWYDADGDGVLDAGEEITAGEIVSNYDPSKLKVQFSGSGSTSFTFLYASIDAAGVQDATPNFYTVSWGTALPIEMLYFTATPLYNKTLLKWATANEIKNDYFMVQHLNGLNQWNDLGKVNGNGTTTVRHDYSFWHNSPMNGLNYYRLKIVDEDGNVDYSNILSVKFSSIGKIELYPNPTSTEFTIRFENELSSDVSIRIIDATGKIVQSEKMTKGTTIATINSSALAVGAYHVHIIAENMNEVVKIVKQ